MWRLERGCSPPQWGVMSGEGVSPSPIGVVYGEGTRPPRENFWGILCERMHR